MESISTTKNKVIVLTGGLGVFGRFLASKLLRSPDTKLIMLVRAESLEKARDRVWKTIGVGSEKIEIICSDLGKDWLGLSQSDYENLAFRATHILHAAASIRFNRPIEEARLYNVTTTRHMLEFAEKCVCMERFGFVSTALVAGNRSGIIKEDEFEHTAGFKNTYEESKYEAEALVRSQAEKLPVAIFRPPLLLTPAVKGKEVARGEANLLILSARLVAEGALTFIPGSAESTVDVVDGRVAADIIVHLSLKPKLLHLTYHITNGHNAPRVKDILSLIERKIGTPVKIEFCGPVNAYQDRVRRIPWYRFTTKTVHRRISSFIIEAAYPKIFDNRNTLSELSLQKLEDKPITVIDEAFSSTENIWKFSV
jgi:thioester reductase-like protein